MSELAQFAPIGEAYYSDRTAFLAGLREHRPVAPFEVPGYGRAWLVTRYGDVRAMLTDPRLAKDVKSWPGGRRSRPSEATGVGKHMLHADPPEHTRLRRVVQRVFTPRCAALRPHIEQIAADLLDALDADNHVVDLLTGYARPLPIAVLSELLGVPGPDRPWIAATVAAYDDPAAHQRVERELAGYLRQLIASRRDHPGDDLLSELISATDHEEPISTGAGRLSADELVSTAYLLVMAGFDTTVNLIASGTVALLTHPDQLATLRQDRSLLPGAVEELLRFTSPVNHANDRFTTEDVRIGDTLVPAGAWVLPCIGSANRDAARFPLPDDLDLGRSANSHLAFGHGVHHCLGAPLARLEAEVAFGALLSRHPRLTLAVDRSELHWRHVSLMNGLQAVPVHLH